MKLRYEEHSWPEIREAVKRDPLIVLPVGTTEQHGPHLPLATDHLCAEEFALRAARVAEPPPIVMRPICYAFNDHHLDCPDAIAVEGETLIQTLFQIGKSLAHHGFRKLLLNGHGSNEPFVDIAARYICNHTEAICAAAGWWHFLRPDDDWGAEVPPGVDMHASESETSLVLYFRPDLVDMSRAADSSHEQQRSPSIWDEQRGSSVFYQEFFSRNTSTGIQGNALPATAEKGERIAQFVIPRLAAFYAEFRAREIWPRRDLH